MKKVNNYKEAVEWFGNHCVLCNNIPQIDESIFDNANFDWYDDENEMEVEIFQWYITNCTQDEVVYLSDRFGLLFTYSDLLDCYILCVDHCGTSWDYVEVFDRLAK